MFQRVLLTVLLLPLICHSKRRRALFSPISKSSEAKRVVNVITTYSQRSKEYCTGTLLSNTLVLTAAHCVHSENAGQALSIDVRLSTGETRRVKKLFLHRHYRNEAPCHDVAILLLDRSAKLTIGPLNLGCKDEWNSGNCTAYGNGVIENGELSESVREVKFRIDKPTVEFFSSDQCWETYYTSRAKLCQGDSGGPVLCQTGSKTSIVGVNVQIVSNYDGDSPLIICKLSYGSIISNYRAILELIQQLPSKYRNYILQQFDTTGCF
ncbi:unnamed protein product [Bursaphelenchus okinawaensis]|uniref:Peptidase S1 domain-containing protein n=1 Tax=Bursaphelenchus okinawaensis TaxID=465554 RepID=A0A811KY87_9BILA|nr:unnamed protein product [Bursaphelenchus okinawaensis]CAG9113658.1 unnamed protein product [Bursaphelenchus okinawaensis]